MTFREFRRALLDAVIDYGKGRHDLALSNTDFRAAGEHFTRILDLLDDYQEEVERDEELMRARLEDCGVPFYGRGI